MSKKFTEIYEEVSNSLMTTLAKNLVADKIHYICPKCDFVVPKYKGKYPRCCPQCGAIVDMNKYIIRRNLNKCGLQVDMEPFHMKVTPKDLKFAGNVNRAMARGFANGTNKDRLHKACPNCKFNIPKYKGRYNKFCPMCGAEINGVPEE